VKVLAKKYLSSDEGKLGILEYLKDKKWHSYFDIHKSLRINYESLKKHLNFLKLVKCVELIMIPPKASSSGQGCYKAKITKQGLGLIK